MAKAENWRFQVIPCEQGFGEKQMKMHDFVKTAFEEEGPLSHCISGYRHSPIQVEYALSVADTLMSGTRSRLTAVSLLEADTGIGKSLGYLIPATWLAAKGKRVAVSTHKNQLQHQLLGTAFPAAAEAARALLGVELRAAPRIGLRHFVSPARALRVIEERELQKKRGDKADLQPFLAWLKKGGALLSDWKEQYGALPCGIIDDDICCRPYDAETELAAYRDHIKASCDADIVFTNHSLCLLHVMGRASLDGARRLSALIIDEADRLPAAAEGIVSKRASLRQMQNIALSVPNHTQDSATNKAARNMAETIKRVWDEMTLMRPASSNVVPLNAKQDALLGIGKILLEGLSALQRVIGKKKLFDAFPDEWRGEIEAYRDILSAINDHPESPSAYAIPAASWSETLGIPAFQMVPIDPGRLLSRYLKRHKDQERLQSMVITSATLSDGQRVGDIASALGIFSNNAKIIKEAHYEPATFGTVEFVLMDDSLPGPSNSKHDTGDAVASNPEWLDNIAALIGEAASKGKRVVVLTLSTRDTLALEKRLRGRLGERLLVQRPGIKLQSLVADYRATRNGVLITPGGWEGLDLPGQIDELIISRLPYLPPNTPVAIARTRQLLNAGFDRKSAERVIYAKSLAEARRRFRQGFGRGIRRHDDSVRIWIGDPRFIRKKDFQQVVPRRFREAAGLRVPALSQALTWTTEGVISQTPEPCIAASWAEDY